MGVSRWGAPINLEGTYRGGDFLSVQDYINTYCMPGTQKMGTCMSCPLKLTIKSVDHAKFLGAESDINYSS